MNKFGKTPAEVIGEYHPLFKSLLWVAAARSTDEKRFAINHVHVERDGLDYKIVATDSKRMHVATFDPGMFDDDIEKIEIGDYEVIAKSAKFIVIAANDEGLNFPDWRKVLPSQVLCHQDSINARTISKLGITTGTLLATDFVTDACGFGCGFKKDASVSIEYAAHPDRGGFLIKHELGTAVVMPMAMHEDVENPPKDDAEATPHIPGLEPAGTIAETPDPPVEQAVKKAVRKMQSDLKKHGATVSIVNPNTGKGVEISADKITPIK
jgi:hypothetical protein